MANPDWKIKEWVSGRLPDFRVAEVALDGAPLPDFTYEIEAGEALPDYTVQFVAEDATPRPDYRISQYMGGGAVATPVGFDWTPDFTVRRAGSTYTTDFNIDARRPAYSVTYYVDPVAGSDSNDGLTEATPKQNLSSTITAANAGAVAARILMKPGLYYGVRGWNAVSLTVTALIEPWAADPTAAASAVIIARKGSGSALTFTLDVGNTYLCGSSPTTDPYHVMDLSSLDADGMYRRLTKAADLTACRATAGTWWRDSGTNAFYCHAFDNRSLIGDGRIAIDAGSVNANFAPTASATLWVQNVSFGFGSEVFRVLPSATTTVNVYFKRCKFFGSNSTNSLTISALNANTLINTYLVGCVGGSAFADGFNYHAAGSGSDVRALEQDCVVVPTGYEPSGTANNASTAHEGCNVVSVNSIYRGSQNRTVHDINASQRWALGCTMGASQAADATAVTVAAGSSDSGQTAAIWLDGCTVAESASSALYAYAGCAIRYRNMALPTTAGAGTFGAY